MAVEVEEPQSLAALGDPLLGQGLAERGHADASKVLVISPDGRDASATIHQDADISD